MEKGKYANLTVKQLQERKKYAAILLVILTTTAVLDGSALIYNLVIGNGFIKILFVPIAACILILISVYIGKKNIEGELKNREDN
jgi:hypothetical protein